MQRTNIYLDERQLALLRQLGARRGEPVAGLVRAAVDEWLGRQGACAVSDDEWQRRFTTLLDRRTDVAASRPIQERQVAADVADAVAQVRSERVRASRR